MSHIMSGLSDFTKQYSLQKTLRFELKPVGRTLENIENKKLISQDEKRAESYKKMKETINVFHKHFIGLALSQVRLTQLKEFEKLYTESAERKKEDNFRKAFEKVQANLRKEIVQGFKTGDAKEIFSKLDKKELITEMLEKWIKTQNGKEIYFDEDFKKFTTYFGGFHENRKNMYTDKDQSTAIAYRLIHENLPKFLDNMQTFEKLKNIPELYEKCTLLHDEIKSHLNIDSIDQAFELDYYNKVLIQKQIDVYNLIIGGKTAEEGKKKIQGLNEYINLHNQKHDQKNRIPKFKPLYKQILSDRESISFLPEKFEDDAESTASQKVLDAIENYYKANLIDFKPDGKDGTENVLKKIKEMLEQLKDYDLSKIHIRNDKAISDISNALFGDWNIIKSALAFAYTRTLKIGKKGLSKKQEKDREKYLKQSHFSIAEIEKALFEYKNENEALKDLEEDTNPIADYFHTHFTAEKKEDSDKEFDLMANIEAKYSCIKGILNTDYSKDKRLHQDKKTIDDIKAFLDSLMEFLHFVKPLTLPSDTTLKKDEVFYSQFQTWYDQLQFLIPLYNKVRNYATQKQYSIEKFKLNFGNPDLLGGWPRDREIATSSVIFKDEKNFFLGILDKESKRFFKDLPKPKDGGDMFFKMVYLQAADPSKDVQNLMIIDGKTVKKNGRKEKSGEFAGQNLVLEELKNTHLPENINEIRKKRSYSKLSEDFQKKDLTCFIEYYKQRAVEYFDSYELKFKKSEEYKDFSEFTAHINEQAYQIKFDEISKTFIDELVNQGKLYLFQIYNKDFSKFSKGKPNLHTMYWKALFDPENLKDVMYKLNGEAEMFYRRKSIVKPTVHKANEPIDNKNPHNPKKKSVFEYDIIKDKRYTVDKFQFHVPITLNFKAVGKEYINTNVLEYLKNNPDVNIIGIDRGERHLIYITLIDQEGNIKEQYSLNEIINEHKGVKHITNYHQLLDKREEERDKARESWGVIENIKELKEGYISQVVHKISKMMVEHNAIVVMEDLNFGFKRGRFKVEKQVYQKLEKMLIDKLNYLVFKDNADTELGGLYKALQLTNKFESFKKLGKQSGFLFYVPAWNTSKIDPTTGFVNLFNTRYENIEKAKTFFDMFDDIRYNADRDYFEFEVKKYSLFNSKADDTKQDWVICTHSDRIRTFRNPEKNNQWDNKEMVLSDEFKKLFDEHEIAYRKNLKKQILSQTEKAFFEKLLSLFRYAVQMRNSITNSDVDYLISPVMNSKGEFYDSRKKSDELPKDADANGAYHIAKKGRVLLERLNRIGVEEFEKTKRQDKDRNSQWLPNKEWLQFAQSEQ